MSLHDVTATDRIDIGCQHAAAESDDGQLSATECRRRYHRCETAGLWAMLALQPWQLEDLHRVGHCVYVIRILQSLCDDDDIRKEASWVVVLSGLLGVGCPDAVRFVAWWIWHRLDAATADDGGDEGARHAALLRSGPLRYLAHHNPDAVATAWASVVRAGGQPTPVWTVVRMVRMLGPSPQLPMLLLLVDCLSEICAHGLVAPLQQLDAHLTSFCPVVAYHPVFWPLRMFVRRIPNWKHPHDHRFDAALVSLFFTALNAGVMTADARPDNDATQCA